MQMGPREQPKQSLKERKEVTLEALQQQLHSQPKTSFLGPKYVLQDPQLNDGGVWLRVVV